MHRPTGDSELKLDSGELVVGSRRYRTHGSLRIAETHRPSTNSEPRPLVISIAAKQDAD